MKTDDLVELLSRNLEPVDRSAVLRTLCFAVGIGIVAALGIAFFGLGVRSDFATTRALIFLAMKLAFAIAIVGLAIVYLVRLTRPGGERKTSPFLIMTPFLVIVLLAAVSLGSAPRAHWDRMIMGDEWLECLLSVPIIAIVPFAASIWAVRKGAPTDLVRAGALAGLIAGAISAIGYALHCTDDSIPFIAVWYGGTIVLCTLAGAVLGPRLLRW
ncbi:DUF1109 domain-containing protein [Bradyrhizobium sp. CB1650]|uniref:DUF1109 domain-containing protein n=1 Tax=Bradyrhizobium sp. CB1650 TaxID=3039153 RepID=UPI0024355004|nr:DUF1109 domain-containing protein [Bradyrhizobium sp. CB1650]WGD50163.1 DUF1109 domain-containing protein [Bradyrhizobium sp. CB1650]